MKIRIMTDYGFKEEDSETIRKMSEDLLDEENAAEIGRLSILTTVQIVRGQASIILSLLDIVEDSNE